MSEIEELKKATDESLRQQRMKDLIVHLQVLTDNVEKARKLRNRGGIVFHITWGIWVAGGILDYFLHLDHVFSEVAFLFFILGWSYDHYTRVEFFEALGKYIGAIEVLEVLGVIDPRSPRGVKNKKKRPQAMVDLVKKWATQKKQAQEEVYQPA